eukprot:scaffold1809_cov386-Prasinococcus_capsulatus_cf.AAC.14
MSIHGSPIARDSIVMASKLRGNSLTPRFVLTLGASTPSEHLMRCVQLDSCRLVGKQNLIARCGSSGGSNIIQLYLFWSNMFTYDLFNTLRERITYYLPNPGADIVDVVWNSQGDVIYKSYHTFEDLGLTVPLQFRDGVRPSGNITVEAQALIEKELAKAPGASNGTRLTLVIGQYWQNSEVLLPLLYDSHGPWESSRKSMISMIMIWYAPGISEGCLAPPTF